MFTLAPDGSGDWIQQSSVAMEQRHPASLARRLGSMQRGMAGGRPERLLVQLPTIDGKRPTLTYICRTNADWMTLAVDLTAMGHKVFFGKADEAFEKVQTVFNFIHNRYV